MGADVKYLSVAETAKLVRPALKAAFPGIRFSVKSSSYAGGASIHIRWIDGPSRARVKEVVRRFEGADFDGMQDMKIYRGPVELEDGRRVRFGADFIFCERSYSPNVYAAAARAVCDFWGVDLNDLPPLGVRDSFTFKGVTVANGYPGDFRVDAADEYLGTLIYQELQDQSALEAA